MAKKSGGQVEELMNGEDSSSGDAETYRPTGVEDRELEFDEGVYSLMEYIDLEWPAQSVDVCDSRIFLGTVPNMSDSRAALDMVRIDIKYTDFKHLNYIKSGIGRCINKLRISRYVFALSDNHLTKYDMDLNVMAEVEGSYGFALYVTRTLVFAGSVDGFVECYDSNLIQVLRFRAHEQSIESIAFENGVIFTGSADHTVKMFKMDGSLVEELANGSEVNCLDVRDGRLVFGDEDGLLHIYNVDTKSRETIEWHASPISLVRWRDSDIFASGSDEQVCLWDVTLEADQECEFNQYLLFVHQGQRLYKDCCFEDNRVIVTAEDGLCVFEPISLANE